MKNGKLFNNYLFLFFSFLFSCFGIFFNLQEVNASTQTNKDLNLYTDYCYYQNEIPYSFENITDTNFDLSNTPYWFISVSRNNDTTLNYNLYALSTSDIFFDLTGGTFYFYTEDTSSTFSIKYFTCSSAIAYADSEIVPKELQNTWTYKWSAERDFANSSWNRSAFRKWFDSDTLIDYNDFITYLPNQEQGPQNAFIVASNFDIFNSNNDLILSKTYNVDITPPPSDSEEESSKIEDTLKDTTLPDSDYSSMSGWLPPGPVDSLINIPLIFLNEMNNASSKGCVPLKLTWFDGSTFEVPCIMETLLKINGFNEIINIMDVVLCLFISVASCVSFYKYVDKKTKLQDNNDLGGVM